MVVSEQSLNEVIMPWVTVNRVPEFLIAMQAEAKANKRSKPSMKAISEAADIDYSVAYNWFQNRINTFNGDVAAKWANYFNRPVVVQAEVDDNGQPMLDDPGSFLDLLDNL
jgi:hypothetical protein